MKTITMKKLKTTTCVTLMLLILTTPALAFPPDPDNAALLYYQGFLTLAELNEESRNRIRDVAKGEAEPDDKVREDISKCIGAIEFAEAAAQVPGCNWGLRYSQGFDALMPQLAQARFLTYVLIADARIRAADGNYRGALERSLTTCTFARHVGDDTLISYLVSLAVRNMGYKCMQDVLGQVGRDAELLRWLRTELSTSSIEALSPARPLKIEMEIVTAHDTLELWKFHHHVGQQIGLDEVGDLADNRRIEIDAEPIAQNHGQLADSLCLGRH